MKNEKHLIVKRSTLPGSGKGLFTKCLIPKDSMVTEYKGKITTWENADHDNGENPYIYYVNKNHVIDAKNNNASLAHYANDADGLKKVKQVGNNSAYTVENKRVFIKAITDIPAGSEILVGYGKEYWDVIKKNKEPKRKRSSLKK
ncbi:MAG: SET domain-containing protein [Ferruginibacter sp.]